MHDHQTGRGHARQLPDRLSAVGPGWHPLLLRMHAQLLALDADYPVEDLKEELGAVRVHIATTSGPPGLEMRALVLSAVERLRVRGR